MTKMFWIFVAAMTTLCVQATGDITALEKKMEMFDKQLKSCDSRLKSYEQRASDHETKLESHGTRLEQLESKPSLCSE